MLDNEVFYVEIDEVIVGNIGVKVVIVVVVQLGVVQAETLIEEFSSAIRVVLEVGRIEVSKDVV